MEGLARRSSSLVPVLSSLREALYAPVGVQKAILNRRSPHHYTVSLNVSDTLMTYHPMSVRLTADPLKIAQCQCIHLHHPGTDHRMDIWVIWISKWCTNFTFPCLGLVFNKLFPTKKLSNQAKALISDCKNTHHFLPFDFVLISYLPKFPVLAKLYHGAMFWWQWQ